MGQTSITAAEAIAALAPLVGAGGISGIVIAIFAYMRAAREGRQGEPEKAGLGISALLADSSSITKLTMALESGALALTKLVMIFEQTKPDIIDPLQGLIDELRKLRRAVEDLPKQMRSD